MPTPRRSPNLKLLGDTPGALTQVLDGVDAHQLLLLRRCIVLNLLVDQAWLHHVDLLMGAQSKQNI